MIVKFELARETRGALRYQEIDDNDQVLEIGAGAKVGTLYIRKDSGISTPWPRFMTVSFSFEEE